MKMFKLSSEPLDAEQLKTATENPTCGALVTFEGWVRNRRDGSVEAVFAGETDVVAAMIEARQRGHRQQGDP